MKLKKIIDSSMKIKINFFWTLNAEDETLRHFMNEGELRLLLKDEMIKVS